MESEVARLSIDQPVAVRLGVSNDYNSQPGRGIKRLDTTYFTQLLLNWQQGKG